MAERRRDKYPGAHHIPFEDFAVMSLRRAKAAHPSSSGPPVSIDGQKSFAEQVIALKIFRACHIAGTLIVFPYSSP
jgi:hypothetical protein